MTLAIPNDGVSHEKYCDMSPESTSSPLLSNGSLKHVSVTSDMAPEYQNSPLVDNGSASTFPRQQMDAVTDELFEMVVSIRFAS
jgi:hypothetical protein